MREKKDFIRSYFVNKTVVGIFVSFLAISLLSAYFSVTCFIGFFNPSFTFAKWQTFSEAQKNYNIFKNAFNDQKRAVIDAYNKQIDKIDKNGLDTETNFTGLNFDNTIFADKVSKNKQVLSYSHEATKAVDKLSETTVNTKIAKIKAFYDARVRNIYSAIKNKQKVVYNDLKEYTRQPNNIQLTEADFTPVATKIVDTRIYTDDTIRLVLLLVSIALGFVAFFSFVICTDAKSIGTELTKKSDDKQ